MALLNDIRYGFRMLVKRPGLSAIAIIALALGIGLTTTMFGIVYGAVIRGLPYEESENLIALFRTALECLADGLQGYLRSVVDDTLAQRHALWLPDAGRCGEGAMRPFVVETRTSRA